MNLFESGKRNLIKKIMLIVTLVILNFNLSISQCSSSCGSDSALEGETSCIDIGLPVSGLELGIDAINANTDPKILAALNGNELVNKLDDCCNNDKDCVTIKFSLDNTGGAYSLEEINSIGSGSVYIDCEDLSNNFEQVIPYEIGQYELTFCPPGGSGAKRIGFAPLFEIEASVTDESIDGFDDGEINVTYALGNPNVSPTGTVLYSIDSIGGTTENNTGIFTGLADGDYTIYTYDSSDYALYNTLQVNVGAGINCDIADPNEDCDFDGVVNSEDCDPLDDQVLGAGSSCVDGDGVQGILDENCFCITESGESSSGGDGGLESNNRLAQKIAQRNFKLKKEKSKLYTQRVTGKIPFKKQENPQKNKEIDFYDLIPDQLWNAYVSESTPIGLTDITNATKVLGVDYFLNDIRTAAALIIKSENGVYEHSKYICDRLMGSNLMNITHTEINNQPFIMYEIENKNGDKEFALSFSSYQLDDQLVIENHWSLEDYTPMVDFINFQIWASSQEKVKSLATSILTRLNLQSEIVDYRTSGIPEVYVQNGYYKNGTLYLTIRNNGPSGNLQLEGFLRRTETSEEEFYSEVLTLSEEVTQSYQLNTGNFYDIGLILLDQKGYKDELFMADGTWGAEFRPISSEILSFEITKQDIDFDLTTLQIERGISMEANVKNYQNVYRSLTPKWSILNLNNYENISFVGQGTSLIELTIVKEGSNWSSQMRTQIALTEHQKEYHLKIADFENYDLHQDLSDAYMIVFTILGNGTEFKYSNFKMENLHFHSNFHTSSDEVSDFENVNFYPNPVRDNIFIDVKGKVISSIFITDLSGTTIYKKNEDYTPKTILDINGLKAGLYILNIITSDGILTSNKLIKL